MVGSFCCERSGRGICVEFAWRDGSAQIIRSDCVDTVASEDIDVCLEECEIALITLPTTPWETRD